MNFLLKKLLLRNNLCLRAFLLSLTLFWSYVAKAQIGNYVTNGSFEKLYNCESPASLDRALGWFNIGSDTTKFGGSLYSTGCYSNAPNTDAGFQKPKTGGLFYRHSPFCESPCTYYYARSYAKNRLKGTLKAGKEYCVKMYVSLEDTSVYAISDLSIYLGDASSDTINYANGPISYINPQIKNPVTNIIIDRVNWVPVSGTFTAIGTEKYLIIGNFQSNAATTKSLVNTWSNFIWSEYFVDDVSCIEVNLPAYAGPDKSIAPGDSAFLGREADFAIDSGCTWYQLPNLTTPIKKISGLWVKPVTTTTYVVRQILECSAEKWDTVVVHMNYVGIEKQKLLSSNLTLFPIPAKDYLELKISSVELFKDYTSVIIYNHLGQVVREEEFNSKENRVRLRLEDLANGIYSLSLKSNKSETVSKRFVIAR